MKKYRINGDRSDIKFEKIEGLATTEVMFEITGEDIRCSDGYHTMDELYEHRIALYIALCRHKHELLALENPGKHKVWRSRLHADGSSYPGWFIMGIGTEKGSQISYHLPDRAWEACYFAEELEKAPEFDGHTSDIVLHRILVL